MLMPYKGEVRVSSGIGGAIQILGNAMHIAQFAGQEGFGFQGITVALKKKKGGFLHGQESSRFLLGPAFLISSRKKEYTFCAKCVILYSVSAGWADPGNQN